MARLSFEQWKKLVDENIVTRCGMTSDDLDDWCYVDDYEDGMSPSRSAARAIRNAKDACGL